MAAETYSDNLATGIDAQCEQASEGSLAPASLNSWWNGLKCGHNQHFFECKHEATCFCGRTARVDVAEGL